MRHPALYLNRGSPPCYPSAEQRQRITSLLRQWPERMEAAVQLQRAEMAALREAVAKMAQRYPNMPHNHQDCWAKTQRDMHLVLTYVAKAVLLQKPCYLEETVLVWFRRLLQSFNFTPQSVADGYTFLQEALRVRMTAESYQWIEPLLGQVIESLSDFPEPAEPAV